MAKLEFPPNFRVPVPIGPPPIQAREAWVFDDADDEVGPHWTEVRVLFIAPIRQDGTDYWSVVCENRDGYLSEHHLQDVKFGRKPPGGA